MICRLCLKDMSEIINIFDEIGTELNVACVLKKYFWFEPKVDDPISTAICNICWTKVINFHEYYISVEEAHRLLAERFFVKARKQSPDVIEQNTDCSLLKAENDPSESSWDTTELNYSYTVLEEGQKANENAEQIPITGPTIDEIHEYRDNDIKQESTEHLECLGRRSSLRSATSLTFPQAENERLQDKHDNSKKSPSHSKKYDTRAKEYDLLIAKHMKLICEFCQLELADFTSLRQHFLSTHKRKGYVVCCNKKLFKRVLLVDHINKHLDPEYFKCHDCNKAFADKQCLRNHRLIMHQTNEQKPFQCKYCPKRFIKQYLLDQHQVIHVPMDERKYPCDNCSKVFPNETTLNTHRKHSHTHDYGQMCHVCAKLIRGKALFEKHQLEHTGVKQPEIQCDKCGSWLKNKHSMQKHLRRHNDEGKLHTCNICHKVAPNQSALRSHFRYVHASQRTYECSVCNKAFKKPLNLKEHMATHTGEVLYSCPHCAKTFNSNANMHSHRKKAHPKEWEANRKHRKGRIVSESSNGLKDKNSGKEDDNDDDNDNKLPEDIKIFSKIA